MPTLELEIGTTKLRIGAREAATAIEGVGKAASQTEVRVASIGPAAAKAFSVAGGGQSIAQSAMQTANAFRDIGTAAGAFATSGLLLDVARTGREFRELQRHVGGTGGALGTLGTIMRAHPLLTIATTLGFAAQAMSAFGKRTSEATANFEKLGEAASKARLDERTARYLGISPLNAQRAQLDALFQGTAEALGSGSGLSVGRLSAIGIDRKELLEQLARDGNRDAASFLERGYYSRMGQGNLGLEQRFTDPSGLTMSGPQVQAALRAAYQRLALQVNTSATDARTYDASRLGPMRSGSEFSLRDAIAGRPGTGTVLIDDEQRLQVNAERQAEMQRQAEERMERLVDLGRQFGSSIGDAFFNVASGTQTARQAIASLIADIARATSRQAFAGIVGAAFGAIGATGTQQQQNVRVPGQS